ncbi:MAG TPA: DUF3102 domain-containing protein [Chthoniobacter sp.]|jgi:hypothetical protein
MKNHLANPELTALREESLALIVELDAIGRDIESKLGIALDKAWQLGKRLVRQKEILGHGKWLLWVESNLPISDRHARRYKELAEANPRATCVGDLSEDSVRKFRLGFVPEKDRPKLVGDRALPRAFHHLTLLNDWRRLERRLEIGQAQLDQEAAKKDLWPMFEWLAGRVYGLTSDTLSHLRPPG